MPYFHRRRCFVFILAEAGQTARLTRSQQMTFQCRGNRERTRARPSDGGRGGNGIISDVISHDLWLQLQSTSVTVTVVGIVKSVTVADSVSDDFRDKKALFGTKKLSL